MENIEKIIFNSYEKNIAKYGDFNLVVPICISDRKIDYRILLAILLRSSSDKSKKGCRYIEYSRIHKKQICKECEISMKTLDRKLKYLIEKNILIAKNASGGLTYYINYSDDTMRYISIPHRILKALYDDIERNAIKVYLFLAIKSKDLVSKKPMSNSYICSNLGYSVKSNNNLSNIGIWTNLLVHKGFIEKEHYKINKTDSNGNNIIVKTDTYYSIIHANEIN